MRAARAITALSLALCVGLFGLCAESFAANPSDEGCNQDPECRAHFMKGRALYKDQDYKSALDEFRAAYERRQTPILLINMGRTLQKLGRPKEALEYYERCQAAARTDKDLQEKLSVYISETKALIALQPKEDKWEGNPDAPEPVPQPLDPTAAAATTVAVAPQPEKKPVYKKWWFWTTIVGVAVVGGAVATGLVFGLKKPPAMMVDPPIDPDVTGIRPMF